MWPFKKKSVNDNKMELVFEDGKRIKVAPEYQENIRAKLEELQKSKNEIKEEGERE